MSYQRTTYSSLADWQGSAPSTSGAPQPSGQEWVPPADWQTYERTEWLPPTQAQPQAFHPTQHQALPQTQYQGYPQPQYPAYPQTQFPGSPLPPPPATIVVPTQTPVPRLPTYQPTPLARPLNPAPPSPAITLPQLSEVWSRTRVETPRDWTRLGQAIDTPVVGSPDQAGPSGTSLFSPVRAPSPSLPSPRKAGRPPAKRVACCDNPPKTQHKRHLEHHCPNGPAAQKALFERCKWCKQVLTSKRKDNRARHERTCAKRRKHAEND